jgi:hypothetical protein
MLWQAVYTSADVGPIIVLTRMTRRTWKSPRIEPSTGRCTRESGDVQWLDINTLFALYLYL